MKFLKSVYLNNLHSLVVYMTLSILLIVFYRIETYFQILAIYPDLKNLSFFYYLSLSLFQDCLFLIFFNLSLAALFVIFSKFTKLKFLMISFFYGLTGIFFFLAINFFKVYETSFQKSFIAKENFTGIKNVLQSMLAELSGIFWIELSLLFLILAFLAYAHSRKGLMKKPKNAILYIPPIFFALFFTGLFFHPSPAHSLLKELAINPAHNFLFEETVPDLSAEFTSQEQKIRTPDSFKTSFNTRSLESLEKQARINLIPRGKKYNIIFYFFESTAYQYLKMQINGRYVMDTWNRLEKNSLNFKNHYANYPLSANAMFSVLTSAYDSNDKDPVLSKYPNIALKTLPEILHENGYRTSLIHTGFLEYAGQNKFLKNRKFDQILEFKHLVKLPGWDYEVGWGVDERAMTQPAVEFIQSDPQKPFFMAFFPVNPHHPYAVPDDSFKITGEIPKNADSRQKTWLNYINSLHYADAALGELIDRLEKEGLLENTLIFLFADHGEAFYQHKMNYNHPFFLYEENVHVPFLIYNKALFQKPRYIESITRHIDLCPTVLDILGILKPSFQEGVSLLSSKEEQFALLHASWKDDFMAIRDSKWKYIRKTAAGTEELYDLSKDPEEKMNLAAKFPEITQKYREKVLSSRKYKKEFFKRWISE